MSTPESSNREELELRPVVVEIKRMADGLIRDHHTQAGWFGGEFNDFIWSDGNYACDCNRALFFARAANEHENMREPQCGDDAYQVNVKDPETGEYYYKEFEI